MNEIVTPGEYREFANRYKNVNLHTGAIPMIQDLLNEGWIEVQEDKRQSK